MRRPKELGQLTPLPLFEMRQVGRGHSDSDSQRRHELRAIVKQSFFLAKSKTFGALLSDSLSTPAERFCLTVVVIKSKAKFVMCVKRLFLPPPANFPSPRMVSPKGSQQPKHVSVRRDSPGV